MGQQKPLWFLFAMLCLHFSVITEAKDLKFNKSGFGLTGFALGVKGGGVIPETDGRYHHVYNAQDLHDALMDPSTKVIEIMNDLNLGFYEIPDSVKNAGVFRKHPDDPKCHPKLMQTGISSVYIQNRNSANGNPGLTIFSEKGATIRHCNLEINDMEDLIIRNLRFDEMYEWDDLTNGDYDENEWDYMTVRSSKGIWFDHLELGRSYDGIIDIFPPSERITISYTLVYGAQNASDPHYVEQFDYLEANRNSFPQYNYLRQDLNISKEDIMYIFSPQKKGHLVGPEELKPDNPLLSITIHNSLYRDMCDRIPRLRAGNAHIFNVIADFRIGQAAKRHKERMNLPADIEYKFQVTSNAAISTEHGAVLVENTKLLEVSSPIRNNQKDLNNPTYTGKILARNVHHTIRGKEYTGTSLEPTGTLVPYPAPDIPFSWNGFTELPYQYSLIDLDDLDLSLAGQLSGAGVRNMGWDKSNWLMTEY